MRLVLSVCFCCAVVHAEEPPARPNLAAGKSVVFAPNPNYSLTAKGDTDEADLTDGKFSTRPDHAMWFESQCVGFSYFGRGNLAVDLGKRCALDEVGMRWQGGSPQAGICFPPMIEVLVSDDGQQYHRVASYSRWNDGDPAAFGVPRDEGKGWIHHLRFKGLNAAGRFVGVSFYGAGLSICDELFVHEGGTGLETFRPEPAAVSSFTVDSAQPYWHKPELFVTRDFATPNSLGIIVGASPPESDAELVLDLPKGVRWEGGSIAGVNVADVPRSEIEGGAFTRYVVPVGKLKGPASPNKTWGRLYMVSDLPDGATGVLRYGLRWEGAEPVLATHPLRSVACPKTPLPKRLTTTMGWWSLGATMGWPDGLTACQRLGLNTIPATARWTDFDDPEIAAFLDDARSRGLKLLNIDSPWHHMLHKNKGNKELFCQFEDGTTGKQFCPSFRGEPYQREVQRVAHDCAVMRADMLTADIELWNWAGPADCAKCTRCQADLAKSGLATLEEWKLSKGKEMWTDLANATLAAAKEAGKPDIELGAYDYRPGMNYQKFWPFDQLYPKLMHNSQPSTYTPLYPYHVAHIGDEVRQDRERLGRSDVIPWLTPGDAGTFPGKWLYYALLECYANGSRGTLYWSGRVWDAEGLLAQARAIRVVTHVEDVIVDGDLAEGIATEPEVRVSGMRKGDEWFMVVADYDGEVEGEVRLRLPGEGKYHVVDLGTGRELGSVELPDGPIVVPMDGRRAVPVHVRPE